MARRLLLGQPRVQEIYHRDGRWSYTVVQPGGAVHPAADRYLVKFEGQGTDRTYAYYLVDHLRRLEHEVWGSGTSLHGRAPAAVAMSGTARSADGLVGQRP